MLHTGIDMHKEFGMVTVLDELGIQDKLCHPLKTRAIASSRIKTDKGVDTGSFFRDENR